MKLHVAWPCLAPPSAGRWELVSPQPVSCACSTRCGTVPSLRRVVWSPATGGLGGPAAIHGSDLAVLWSQIGTPGLRLLLLRRAPVAYGGAPHQPTQPSSVACCFRDFPGHKLKVTSTVAVLCDIQVFILPFSVNSLRRAWSKPQETGDPSGRSLNNLSWKFQGNKSLCIVLVPITASLFPPNSSGCCEGWFSA